MAAQGRGSGSTTEAGPKADEKDDVLLARVVGGDVAAFRALVERHLDGVLAVAASVLRDTAEAEDVAQDTLLRLWNSRNGLQVVNEAGGLRPWLGRVARNLCIDRMRAGKRVTVVETVPDTPIPPSQADAVEAADVAGKVALALAELAETQRLALTLFHYQGYSQREIGATMDLSDEAVESLLARGRRKLKERLRETWRDFTEDTG